MIPHLTPPFFQRGPRRCPSPGSGCSGTRGSCPARGGGQGWGRVRRGDGGSAGNETPGQLGTAGTAAFGIPLPALAPRRDGHGHHGHATPSLGQSVGQERKGRLTGGERGGGDECEPPPGRCDRGCRQRPGLCCRLPPRRGPGAKGRAARPSRKETAPNKAPVGLEQLVPAHQPPTGPGNTSRPRGRAPAPAPAPRGGTARPGPAAASASSLRPGEEPSATPRGEFRPRGEPHRPRAELPRCCPRCCPGIPGTLRWPRLPAVGIPDASGTARWREMLRRHCQGAFRWPPQYQATASPDGVTQVGDAGPLSQGTSEPAVPPAAPSAAGGGVRV